MLGEKAYFVTIDSSFLTRITDIVFKQDLR